jgi:hypothetical protein
MSGTLTRRFVWAPQANSRSKDAAPAWCPRGSAFDQVRM